MNPRLPKTPESRLAFVMDLYAPMVENEDGTCERDPDAGIISREDALLILDSPLT